MVKKFNIKILIIIMGIIIVISYFFITIFLIGDDKSHNIKKLISNEHKQIIKKYFFPYKLISIQQKELQFQKKKVQRLTEENRNLKVVLELNYKKGGRYIRTSESNIKLSNNKNLKKYKLLEGFYSDIYKYDTKSGYIDFSENREFILSSRGVLAFGKNLNDQEVSFKQIQNNINNFIGIKEFTKSHESSIKDLLISKGKIFVSYTEEIKEDCWNTSIIYGIINYENIKFKNFFSPKECVHSIDNIDKEFALVQSGGRMVSFNDNYILLTIGDYRSRHLAQDKKSLNGKIIKINIDNSDYKIISMGHRNPQGLYFDKENDFIIETEHGPQGGDEINLIEVSKASKDKILNYGWPMASAGKHYGGKRVENKKLYKKYPLYKSHSKYGFIEPLMSFVPSIAISEIVKIGKNEYAVSSMKDKSLYFFELNKQREIINLDRLEVFERVRDLKFKNNKLYLFMEDTASIGVISLFE